MEPSKHIVIFSHGFGVRKDDLGLLTDIAAALPGIEPVLFDYFEVNEEEKTLTIRPLSEQAKMLNDVVSQTRQANPEATIDLICHSQGTMVAALAKPESVRKTILLAPAFDMSPERSIRRYGEHVNLRGVSKLPPVDGFVRIVPAEYWAERRNMQPFEEYNALAEKTEMIVIEANQDQLLPKIDLEPLSSKAKIMPLDGDHNFTGAARESLKIRLKELLL